MLASMGTPYYLAGHMAPVPDEIDAHELRVTGALPPELAGRYLRNGPNPRPGEDPGHLFFGHGMVHGVRITGGRAEWYRNRWVRTGQLAGGRALQPDGTIDRTVGSANTHVMAHAGRIYALVESAFPYELTPELDTIGPCDFGGRLTTGMTAHPKEHPDTGDLHFFGYGFLPPYLTYHRLSAAGVLEVSVEIDVPGPTMNHDFAITDRHALFLDQPITFQFERLATGMPFAWDDAYGARIGVMELNRPGVVRWFEVDPGYVFHVGNAHTDERGRIVLEAPRHGPADAVAMWDVACDAHGSGRPGDLVGAVPAVAAGRAGGAGGPGTVGDAARMVASSPASGLSQMHRWMLDPATGTVHEEAIDDRGVEFPTLDDSLTGRRNRYLYTRADAGEDVAVIKYDVVAGTSTEHVLGPDVVLGEAEFVPSPLSGRGEDDGWLMAMVNTRDGRSSHLLVLDSSDVAAAPVATIHLPRRVPTGFHGSWIPDTDLIP